MEDYSIDELYYILLEDSDFAMQLNNCQSEQEIISLLEYYGVPQEYYEELKAHFLYEIEESTMFPSSAGLCLGIGFGNDSGVCSGEGKTLDNEETSGQGFDYCKYVGVGFGGQVNGC